MHQDTAVSVSFLHDSATMLSIVDSANSMNSGARAKFLSVLKGVVNPSHCNFIDDTQRGPAMKSMLLRWATGAVSNYDYLLFLNQIAGRTNMDFNQYPVFPWVIADYTSKHLDLEQPDTFRLFNYPMGAQTEQRREAVTQLYNNTKEILDPETGKSYPFHHGTHYSSSGAVLYFMIRSEPYTTFAKFFQGGDFDIATRLFDSVSASYNSCVLGPADCKELTPEFYQNGQFLMNLDNLDFGSKSDGVEVNNVVLPPWAKNSTQVFTSVMRFALESEFVLNHIHAWIDLVFGVRRRGKLAFERYNIFQRMTYGEEVRSALKEAETRHDTNCDYCRGGQLWSDADAALHGASSRPSRAGARP
ncbi:hypothetical protein AGDE_13222 [Angomonas deanei]|nr:hypothetical protein AGDE_13222 [Angomonas deanei]|eukprot:EPY22598.1 hypothetical protein AGDE_13222 [Angomonas deanei]